MLKGKVAVVTGGNSGIGKATAKLFCQNGAKVVVVSRRKENNAKVVEEIRNNGGEIISVAADVSNIEDCKKAIDSAVDHFGQIDILVNNAGIGDEQRPINDCSFELYDKVVKVDQYSVFYMSKFALEYMEKQGCGSVVNVSSIGSQGIAGISYSAAKAAVNSMTKNIAILYGDTDIRCNAVAPGPTPTELLNEEKMKKFNQDFAEKTAKHIDLTLPKSTPEDQANAILFFACDMSKSITGQILYVDHGTSLY